MKLVLGTVVGLIPGDFVLDGEPARPPNKGGGARGQSPQFSAHVYCGQTAGWIKMALRMKLGLGPVHIVLDGDTAPLPKKKEQSPPIFGPSLLWPNGWMHQDATWYGGRPQPKRLCVRWRPSHLPQKGRSPTQFSAHVYCVRCGPSYSQKKRHTHLHPIFGPRLFWSNGWMDEDAAWYGSRRGPGSPEWGTAAPLFSAHVFCGQGRPSQLLLSCCSLYQSITVYRQRFMLCPPPVNTVRLDGPCSQVFSRVDGP